MDLGVFVLIRTYLLLTNHRIDRLQLWVLVRCVELLTIFPDVILKFTDILKCS